MLTPQEIQTIAKAQGVNVPEASSTSPTSQDLQQAWSEPIANPQITGSATPQSWASYAFGGTSGLGIQISPQKVLSSAGNVGIGLGQALFHPIQTIKGLVGLAEGAGETGMRAVGQSGLLGKDLQTKIQNLPKMPEEQQFGAMVDYFKNRYGGFSNLMNTIQNDPVGFALDVSVLAGGVSPFSKTAQTVSEVTDPLKAATTIGQKGMEAVGATGRMAGALGSRQAPSVVQSAFEAGKAGGATEEAFKAAQTGAKTSEEIVGTAKTALDNIQTQRATDYAKAMDTLQKTNTQSLDFTPVLNKQQELFKRYNIKVNADGSLDLSKSPLIRDEKSAQAINKLIQNFGSDPQDATVKGMDILKRQIKDFRGNDATFNSFVDQMSNSVGDAIKNQVPGYSKVMSEYGAKSDLITSIQKDLALNDKASIDRAFRNISQAVKKDNQFKTQLLTELQNAGGNQIMSELAGANLKDWLPNDIFRVSLDIGTMFAALSGRASPLVILDTFTTSPRLVGNIANALGISARVASQMTSLLKKFGALGGVSALMKSGYYLNQFQNQPTPSSDTGGETTIPATPISLPDQSTPGQ